MGNVISFSCHYRHCKQVMFPNPGDGAKGKQRKRERGESEWLWLLLFVYNLSICESWRFHAMQSHCINFCHCHLQLGVKGGSTVAPLSASSWNNVSFFIVMQLKAENTDINVFSLSLCLKLMFWLTHTADLINTNREKKLPQACDQALLKFKLTWLLRAGSFCVMCSVLPCIMCFSTMRRPLASHNIHKSKWHLSPDPSI